MNEYRDDRKWCHFHPREMVVGVCALCLNDRLLVLVSEQSHLQRSNQNCRVAPKRVLPKIFAVTSLLRSLDTKQQKSVSEVYHSASTSQEDSFISIKFEDNGVASWDKGKISKIPHKRPCGMSDKIWDKPKKVKHVAEQAKTRATQRWRRRIGRLFQLIRWKRSSRGNVCQVGKKLEESKATYGCIKALIKKRARE